MVTEISAVVSLFTAIPLPPFSGEAGDHQYSGFDGIELSNSGLAAKV